MAICNLFNPLTDNTGNSVKTKTVTLSKAPSLKITQQPTDIGGPKAKRLAALQKNFSLVVCYIL